MSDGGRPTPGCLDSETLAAFIDGRLESRGRAQVEAHLAECEDCYEVWVEARSQMELTLTAHLTPDQRRATSRPSWRVMAAIAASVVVVLWTGFQAWSRLSPDRQLDTAISTLAQAASQWRPVAGRVSAPFEWSPAQTPLRTGGIADPPASVSAAAFRLRELASTNRTAKGLHAEGIAVLMLGRFSEAVTLIEEARTLAPESAEVLLDLSAALLARAAATGERADLVRALDAAERSAQAKPDDARPLFNQALVLEELGLLDRARRLWESYLAIDGSSPWATEARERLRQLAARLAGRIPLSRDESKDDVAVMLAAGARVISTRCLTAGTQRYRQAQAAVAARLWDEALREASAAEQQWFCAGVEALPATIVAVWATFMKGEYPKAVQTASALQARVEQLEMWNGAARLRYITGLWHASRAQISLAQSDLEKASEFAERSGDVGFVANTDAALGELLDEQGDRNGAWRFLVGGLEALTGTTPGQPALDLIVTSAIAAGHARWPGACVHFADEAIRLGEEQGDTPRVILGRLQKSRALASLNRTAEAVAELASATAAVNAAPTGGSSRAWRAELGWIEGLNLRDAEPQRALQGLSAAIDYFQAQNRPFRLAELLLTRGTLYARLGERARATEDLEKGAVFLEDQRPALRSEQLRITRSAEVWELFGQLIDLNIADAAASLAIVERARSRELLDHIGPDRQLKSKPISELQAVLPEDAVALEYAVRPQHLLIWTVTRSAVKVVMVPVSAAELAHYIAETRRELAGNRIGEASRRLSTLLIPNGLNLSPNDLLILVPDGPINAVPFAALPFNGLGFLIDQARLTTAPSLTVFDVASQRASAFRPESALLVGMSLASPRRHLSALPAVRQELDRISGVYAQREVLNDEDATAVAVLAALPRHAVVHLAGHAVVNLDVPSRSSMVLWPDDSSGALQSGAIAASSLQSGAVVVLAACDTAAGIPFAGEGPLSLVRPFLGAGAAAVVGALWPVADAHAGIVLAEFHSSLTRHSDPATALALAQRQAIRSGVPPSGWAGFILTGGAFSTAGR